MRFNNTDLETDLMFEITKWLFSAVIIDDLKGVSMYLTDSLLVEQ